MRPRNMPAHIHHHHQSAADRHGRQRTGRAGKGCTDKENETADELCKELGISNRHGSWRAHVNGRLASLLGCDVAR